MKKAFLIATTFDRFDGLKTILSSVFKFYPDWSVVIVTQGYTNQQKYELDKFVFGRDAICIYKDELIGAHSAKILALNEVEADIYCSLDDDMEITEKTDYNSIVERLMSDKQSGIITSNWVKSRSMFYKKQIKDEFVKSRLVFTGGGLLFRKDIANIIKAIPNEQYLFDDCLWAMYSYIHGYDNYRYRGSISIHRICTKGGRRTWIDKGGKKVLPPKDYLNVRKGNGKKNGYNEYLICTDNDLTEYAKMLHDLNKTYLLNTKGDTKNENI